MTVAPLHPERPGRFKGTIWVENVGFRIARIDGTFTPRRLSFLAKYLNPAGLSTLGIFFHFESRRQEVSPGVWMPSYVYFDDKVMWNEAHFTTSYHFRGHTWIWGYHENESGAAPQHSTEHDPVAELQLAGLIASPGPVERFLDSIVSDIQVSASVAGPDIHCRILLTTPVEMFSVGNTIIVSRGLLNIVPDQSVLVALLARQVAHVTLGHRQAGVWKRAEIFDERRRSEFPGFGFVYGETEDSAARERTLDLLSGTQHSTAILKRSGLRPYSQLDLPR